MKNKIIEFWAFIVLTCLSAHAQIISPSVISAGGGYSTSESGSLAYTIAEMTMVETFVQGSVVLTQGFHQPERNTVSTNDQDMVQNNMLIYPNPASGQIKVSFLSDACSDNSVLIYNLQGAIIVSETFESKNELNTMTIDIRNYVTGIYTLKIFTKYYGRKIVSQSNFILF